jgi:hypothetical protein
LLDIDTARANNEAGYGDDVDFLSDKREREVQWKGIGKDEAEVALILLEFAAR